MSPRNRRRLVWGVCGLAQAALLAVAVASLSHIHVWPRTRGWPLVWSRWYPGTVEAWLLAAGHDRAATTHHNWAVPVAAGLLATSLPVALLGPLARRVGPAPRPPAPRGERLARVGLAASVFALGFAAVELETATDAESGNYEPGRLIGRWAFSRFPQPLTADGVRPAGWLEFHRHPDYQAFVRYTLRDYRADLFGLDWNDPPAVQWGRRQDYTLGAGLLGGGGWLLVAGRPWRRFTVTTPPPA